MSQVWLNYAKVIGFIGSNFCLALAVSWFLRSKLAFEPSARVHALVILAGTAFLLVAGLGKLGWTLQTWDGNTPPEQLNDLLFRIFSYLGMFFVFFEWVWSYSKK